MTAEYATDNQGLKAFQKHDYDPAAYTGNAIGCFKAVSNALNFYNATFESAVEEPAEGQEQQFLDIGCGCGRVTRELLLPSCQEYKGRIVAVDACGNMVSYAQNNSMHPKILYKQLDITGDVAEFVKEHGLFDRAYSFNVFNRVTDQAAAWENVARLLRPGGECLLYYGAWYVTPEIWRKLAQRIRWNKFKELWESMIPGTQDMSNAEERLEYTRSLVEAAGLRVRSCEMVNCSCSLQEYMGVMTALMPGSKSLTPEERLQLSQDAEEEMYKWLRGRENPVLAKNFVVHAVKTKNGVVLGYKETSSVA
ncbi:juvenile hormone acid O-methyltransferase-like [Amblyomma americanum]